MKDTLVGDASLNWHAAIPVGLWQGVAVGGPQERVIELALAASGLNGRIPPELGRLDGLVRLNLAVNRLTGPVPPELGRLVRLRELSLDRNDLTGTVPAELGQLSRLESLWLRENRLTGPVPPELLASPEHDLGGFLRCVPPPHLHQPLFDDCALLLAVKETLTGEGRTQLERGLAAHRMARRDPGRFAGTRDQARWSGRGAHWAHSPRSSAGWTASCT